MFLAPTRGNPFQRRRVASQTKPLQECHPERSEGSLFGERSFAALRMTKRDGLFFERYWTLPVYSSMTSSGRGGGRRGTGEDWIMLVVVEPYKRKPSRSRSS